MDIQTVVVGGGPVASLIVLTTRKPSDAGMHAQLPIRIGTVEATAISMGIDGTKDGRPMTHDLFVSTLDALGATIDSVNISDVHGTTFYATVNLITDSGRHISVDARPSDAIALAVRCKAPIFASESVLQAATLPDFASVEKDEKEQELQEFHDFVEGLSPEDFNTPR
mgnify:CR=1 FL=1|jgi:bifunctional DNase/RNase